MKKSLITLFTAMSLFATNNVQSQSAAAQRAIDFNTMEMKHKDRCIQLAKDHHDGKFDLFQKHHDECAALRNQNIKNLDKANVSTPEGKDKIFNNCVDSAIALHKKHRQEWAQFHKDSYDAELKLFKQNGKELDDFEQGSGMMRINSRPMSTKLGKPSEVPENSLTPFTR